MTRGDYHAIKDEHLIGSDIEAIGAVDFVLALVEADADEARAAGPEKEENLEALETTIYQLEALRDDVQEHIEE